MANLDNVQGDLFSRGFAKLNETFYFFTIKPGKEKDFTKALNDLGKSGLISNLRRVLDQWAAIDGLKARLTTLGGDVDLGLVIPMASALIAFTRKGLDQIQTTSLAGSLELDKLGGAFNAGMAANGLNDPASTTFDAPFKDPTSIHGVIKVAGSDSATVTSRLVAIQQILKLGSVITDVGGTSSGSSKVDGQVRPKATGLNGHEHFGFEDGISQPLMAGIDKPDVFTANPGMQTPQERIILKKGTRPEWTEEGSYLVFRKLEQDVLKFNKFCTDNRKAAGCNFPGHLGAKLMGRWKSGAPLSTNPEEDPGGKLSPRNNEFKFDGVPRGVCPMGAHVPKTNPRNGVSFTTDARIVRNGIPYGREISEDSTGTRGLLFACYQSEIEKGFKFIQSSWANSPGFPAPGTGFDPIIGQPPPNTTLETALLEATNAPLTKIDKFVTMRGGEYFFVPSLSALTTKLGSA